MQAHPIMDSSRRWISVLLLVAAAIGIYTGLLMTYAGAGLWPALTDGTVSVVLFCGLAYLSWFAIGIVSSVQTEIVVSVLAILFWLAGGFAMQEWIELIGTTAYAPFVVTAPFRGLSGILCWIVIMMWYRLLALQAGQSLSKEEVMPEEEEPVKENNVEETEQPVEEFLNRITVKDGTRIHLINTEDLLYVQACGDYVTLVTPEGQYVKEITMKYLETHLSAAGFVRIHRSTIVNVTQISRVELFGKESYRLLLKNGDKLRVSLSGYKLLMTRLAL